MLTEHFEHLLDSLGPVLKEYGYAALFVLIFVENFGLPVPGETAFLAAILMAARGEMQIAPVAIDAWTASFLGGIVGFAIGRFGGRRLLDRYGGYVGLTPPRLKTAETFVQKYGGLFIAGARFFDGLRQIHGILAGCAAMSWRKFLAYNALGALLWVGFWTTMLLWFGHHARRIWLMAQGHLAVTIPLLVTVTAIVWYLYRHLKQAQEPSES